MKKIGFALGVVCLSVLLTTSTRVENASADQGSGGNGAKALISGMVTCERSEDVVFVGLYMGMIVGVPANSPEYYYSPFGERSGVTCAEALSPIAAIASAQRACVFASPRSLFEGALSQGFVCSGRTSSVIGGLAAITEAIIGVVE